MENLLSILNQHEVESFEVAEMIYAYLMEYGDDTDYSLMNDLYNSFLKKGEVS